MSEPTEKRKQRIADRLARGLCIVCGEEEIATGETTCQYCKAHRTAVRQERAATLHDVAYRAGTVEPKPLPLVPAEKKPKPRPSTEELARRAEALKQVRDRLRSEHKCTRCAQPVERENPGVLCFSCKEKVRQRQERYNDKRAAKRELANPKPELSQQLEELRKMPKDYQTCIRFTPDQQDILYGIQKETGIQAFAALVKYCVFEYTKTQEPKQTPVPPATSTADYQTCIRFNQEYLEILERVRAATGIRTFGGLVMFCIYRSAKSRGWK